MKISSLILASIVCLSQPTLIGQTNSITVENVFPSPPEALVDLFIPPTRVKEPYAASSRNVYQFRPSDTNWVSIYSSDQDILALEGYSKNSSVLYVAGLEGLAATRDGGKSWTKTRFPDAVVTGRSFVEMAVNPINRREAVLAFTNRLFLTADGGETLNEILLPGDSRTIKGAVFAGTDAVRLVVLGDSSLLVSTSGGSDWTMLPIPEDAKPVFGAGNGSSQVTVCINNKQLARFDLAKSSMAAADIGTFANRAPILPDAISDGLFWAPGDNALALGAVIRNSLAELGSIVLDAAPTLLRAHPRQPGQVFAAFHGQHPIVVAKVATNILSTSMWGFSEFQPVSGLAAPVRSPVLQTPNAENLVAQLLATQPPLDTVVAAALKNARHKPEAIERWQKRAKTRNWIPELRVSGGAREYPVDRIERFDFVDRFGIPQQRDLRLSDEIEPMGYASVSLVWDLSGIFFDRDEVEVNQEKRAEIKQRNDLITQITTLYYERIELLARKHLRGDKIPAEERISLSLKIRQKTDILNELTGTELLAHRERDVFSPVSATRVQDSSSAGSVLARDTKTGSE